MTITMMEWNKLAMLRAYKAIGDQGFKTSAVQVWKTVKQGCTDVGGGIYWQTGNKTFKNTPANMPACIFAAKFYQINHNDSDLE
jgi:predicted alpha-1,6-mannanase (GH76 family)